MSIGSGIAIMGMWVSCAAVVCVGGSAEVFAGGVIVTIVICVYDGHRKEDV